VKSISRENLADGSGRSQRLESPAAARWLAWLVPDLALTFALVTLGAMFVMFHGATSLFRDTDAGWHILDGERIILTRSLPHADPFSFSKPGQPWVAWEWGADILMGAVYRLSGLAGVALTYGLLIAASVWMWFRLNGALKGSFLLSGLFFVPMLTTTMLHWLARPHVISWLFLLGTVWFCERMPRNLRWQHLTLVAIGAAAWANLHASFFFGPVIALVYATGAWLRPLIWNDQGLVDGKGHGFQGQGSGEVMGRRYLLLAMASLAATLVNPNGWRLHQHVFSYLFDSGLLNQIVEFQSFDFHQEGASQIIVALILCFAGAFAALAVHKPERFLLSLLLAAIALRSERALPVAALVLLPLANGSITAILRRVNGLTPWLRGKVDNALSCGDRLYAVERHFHGLAIIPVVAVLILGSIRNSAGFPASKCPVAASAVIASLPAGARILASDDFGGYLIFRFKGERKVFLDGRSDFYGGEFLKRYSRMAEARPGWRGLFNQWDFTNALLPPDSALIPALEVYGWHELYRDETAVLLAGRSKL